MSFFNWLTVANIFLTLTPIIFVDIYGLVKYRWGTQLYITLIETLILALFVLIISILEFRQNRQLRDPIPQNYNRVLEESTDMMKRIE